MLLAAEGIGLSGGLAILGRGLPRAVADGLGLAWPAAGMQAPGLGPLG
jgi:hypothetical protein